MAAPTRPTKQWIGRLVGWAAFALVLVFIWPASLGGATTLVVVSGHSMEPTYSPGDLVVLRKQAEYRAGDIIAYRPFDDVGASVIHRITAVAPDGRFTIRGDNNDFDDPFDIDVADIQGAALFMIPKIGRFLVFLSSPWVWISLFLIAIGVYFYVPKTRAEAE